MMSYWAAFSLAFVLSLTLTPIVRNIALRAGRVDLPNWRKIHTRPIPRLGGIAITIGFLIPFLLNIELSRATYGLLGGVIILFIIGIIDDVRGLGAWYKLIGQIVAAGVVLAGGLGIVDITNPLGGVIALDGWRIPIEVGMFKFNIVPLANLVSILWIVGMINTINFLDGLDGLAGGVGSIAALVIFVLALTTYGSPFVALMAIILAGALLGFLPYNFFPASIFMGDAGAYVLGLLLAIFSIYSESKIAVGALVLGFAIVDAAMVVMRRLLRKQSPFNADRRHLHHQLLDSGLLSHRQVVLLIYCVTILVATTLLSLGGVAAFALLVLLLTIIMSAVWVTGQQQR